MEIGKHLKMFMQTDLNFNCKKKVRIADKPITLSPI